MFWISDNLHHLERSVSFSEAADNPATFTKINVPPQVFLCFIKFSGNKFSQDCSGHYSVKCHVSEKVWLLSYGSKSYIWLKSYKSNSYTWRIIGS